MLSEGSCPEAGTWLRMIAFGQTISQIAQVRTRAVRPSVQYRAHPKEDGMKTTTERMRNELDNRLIS
jgi:hypothetical protein